MCSLHWVVGRVRLEECVARASTLEELPFVCWPLVWHSAVTASPTSSTATPTVGSELATWAQLLASRVSS